MRNVGLDLGSRKISFCEVSNGKVIARKTVGKVEELDVLLGPQQPAAWVAIEASRAAWAVHRSLVEWGNKVSILDTTRVRRMGIGQHGKKNDSIDAETIARAVEEQRLPEAHVLSEPRQELRHLMMSRRSLVESRSCQVTTIRGIATSFGVALPKCEPEDFATVMYQRRKELPARVRVLVEPLLKLVVTAEEQLRVLDEKLEGVCAADEVAKKLMTAPAVGPVIAGMFISVIDSAARFHSGRQVASYLGLVPRENSSGSSGRRLGSITKQGNGYLRALLVQSAWVMMRKTNDDPLARWGRAVAEKRGKRIAAVAVARRVAIMLWAMWRRNVAYDPVHVAELSAVGYELGADVLRSQAEAMRYGAAKAKARASNLKRRQRKSAALAASGSP